MVDFLQNAKPLRECTHKEILFSAWIVTDEAGLEFKICKKCYDRLRHLAGLKIRAVPLSQSVEIAGVTLTRIIRD